MNKVIKRLLTFFIGLPLILAIVLIPYQHHLAFNIIALLFSIACTSEMHNMLSTQAKLFNKISYILFNALICVSTVAFKYAGLDQNYTLWILLFEIFIYMGIECFTQKTFENSAKKLSFSAILLFYCGYLVTFVIRIGLKDFNSSYYLALFLVQVFMCDSCAWLFGVLFGKNNRGYIAASPNKSLIGFAGGIAGSIFFTVILKLIFPSIFILEFWKMILLSILTALAAIVGDLIESVFKRSCDFKDSGNIIPGRGGALDSVDSLLIAAPVYFIILYFFGIF